MNCIQQHPLPELIGSRWFSAAVVLDAGLTHSNKGLILIDGVAKDLTRVNSLTEKKIIV